MKEHKSGSLSSLIIGAIIGAVVVGIGFTISLSETLDECGPPLEDPLSAYPVPGTTAGDVPQRGAVPPVKKVAHDPFALSGVNNPWTKLNSDEVTLNFETRKTVNTTGASYTIQLPSNPRQLVVGFGSPEREARANTLLIRDANKTAETLFEIGLRSHGKQRWQDVSLDVSDLATSSLEMRLASAKPQDKILLSKPTVVTAQPQRRYKNLLLISLDTLRSDYLGYHGYADFPTSPFLDEFAAGGTAFMNAKSPSPWTVPSHMSLFTGFHPDALGMDRLVGQTPRLPDAATTLAEIFSDNGFLSVAFTGRATLSARNGYVDGFHLYREANTSKKFLHRDLDTNIHAAVSWLKNNRTEPLFLFFHTFEAHAPYSHSRFVSAGSDNVTHDKEAYASGIAYLDDGVRKLMGELKTLGLLEDSLVVIASDHGEAFMEHPPHMEHGEMLYDEVLNVPLIFSGASIPQGKRVVDSVGTIDAFATILDLFDLPIPDHVASKSRKMQIFQKAAVPDEPVYLCCMAHGGQQIGLRTKRWKFVQNLKGPNAIEHLFDLVKDPQENRDLAATHPDVVRRLRGQLQAIRQRNQTIHGKLGVQSKVEMDNEYIEQLRALGYIK